jgi:hypothetical protein
MNFIKTLQVHVLFRTEAVIRQLAGIISSTLAPLALRHRFSTILPFRTIMFYHHYVQIRSIMQVRFLNFPNAFMYEWNLRW